MGYNIRALKSPNVLHWASLGPSFVPVRANGVAIRAFRELRGISLRRFAQLIGTSPTQVSRIEREKQNPSSATFQRIAEVLDVPEEAIDRETSQ